jgi:hypothetical protein
MVLAPEWLTHCHRLDNRLALALFVLGTVVGSIIVEGNQWLKRWITTSDPDR